MPAVVISALRDEYLAALLAGDGTRARHLVADAIDHGASVADVYLEVLEPALVEVGKLWEAGKLGVAYEHFASTVTHGLIASLGPRMRQQPTGGRLAVLACSPGEMHALGVQMVGDFLEGKGWEVLQLGPSVPALSLCELVADEQPDVVGLSTATPGLIGGVEETVALLRELSPTPFVVVGGRAWEGTTDTARRRVGADAVTVGVQELVELVTTRFPPLPDED